jgi:2-methylisocitrate lyase-like PEP mutase family enzyme
MNQGQNAGHFAELHVKGRPVLLYNAWDAGSAKAILATGAQAIATSSWSVAEAQGYRDGEAIPIALAEQIVGRIAATIDAPVTVEFEGGNSENDDELAGNIARLLDLGVSGINLQIPRLSGHLFRQITGHLRARPVRPPVDLWARLYLVDST